MNNNIMLLFFSTHSCMCSVRLICRLPWIEGYIHTSMQTSTRGRVALCTTPHCQLLSLSPTGSRPVHRSRRCSHYGSMSVATTWATASSCSPVVTATCRGPQGTVLTFCLHPSHREAPKQSLGYCLRQCFQQVTADHGNASEDNHHHWQVRPRSSSSGIALGFTAIIIYNGFQLSQILVTNRG